MQQNVPAASELSYADAVVRDVQLRILQIREEYEDYVNKEREALDDGKHHNKFSCRIKENGMSVTQCVTFMLTMKGNDLHEELNSSFLFYDMDTPPGSYDISVV